MRKGEVDRAAWDRTARELFEMLVSEVLREGPSPAMNHWARTRGIAWSKVGTIEGPTVVRLATAWAESVVQGRFEQRKAKELARKMANAARPRRAG